MSNPVDDFLEEFSKEGSFLSEAAHNAPIPKLPSGMGALTKRASQVEDINKEGDRRAALIQQSIEHGALHGAGGLIATGIAAGTVMAGKKIYDAMTKSRDFKSMLRSNPDLQDAHASNPGQFNQMYTSLRSMNPAYAKDPIIAGGFMRQMHESPQAAWSVLTGNVSPVAGRDKFKNMAQDEAMQGFRGSMLEGIKAHGQQRLKQASDDRVEAMRYALSTLVGSSQLKKLLP